MARTASGAPRDSQVDIEERGASAQVGRRDDALRRTFSVIVVGLGGFGSGALYWLAKRLGGDVLGLEQFELGHQNGASQDHSRIIRLSYHRPDYVRLAERAYATWAELESEAGVQVVTRTGGLDLAPRDAAIPMDDYARSMRACGVPFEELDAGEVMRRWPQWRLDEDIRALFQPESGIADPNRAIPAQLNLARAHGARIVERAAVTSIRDMGDGIDVVAGSETYRAQTVVLATDAWTNPLLSHLHRRLPLTITKEQVTYFACPRPSDFSPDRFPIWIWLDEPCYFGFPTYGEAGPKAAQDVGGPEVSPEARDFAVDGGAFDRVAAFLAGHLPGALGPPIYTKTCLYTLTPDRDFVIDRLPDHPNVLVALGAAHGFKFSSVIGRILSELALDGRTASDITRFRIDRPILLEAEPARHFMV